MEGRLYPLNRNPFSLYNFHMCLLTSADFPGANYECKVLGIQPGIHLTTIAEIAVEMLYLAYDITRVEYRELYIHHMC